MKKIKILIPLLVLVCTVSMLLLPSCNKEEKVYMEEDTYFRIDLKESQVLGMSASAFIDQASAQIVLYKDGRCKITAVINPLILLAINLGLQAVIDDNMDTIEMGLELAYDYFPGFDLADMKKSMELIEKGTGLSLLGIDFSAPPYSNLESLKDGKLPKDFGIPAGFGVEYNRDYKLVKQTSLTEGEMTAVYMGADDYNGEPFTVLLLDTDADGKYMLKLRYEVADATIVAYQK